VVGFGADMPAFLMTAFSAPPRPASETERPKPTRRKAASAAES
jgi:hypothetical protein